MLLCHSRTLLENQEVQNDFNGCEKDSFLMKTKSHLFFFFHAKAYKLFVHVRNASQRVLTMYVLAKARKSKVYHSKLSHCIALTIKKDIKLHYFEIWYSMQILLKLAATVLFY